MIERWFFYQVGKDIVKGINEGCINFFDKYLFMFFVDFVYGYYIKDKLNGKFDVVVVEVFEIKEDGSIVFGVFVGVIFELIQMVDKVSYL